MLFFLGVGSHLGAALRIRMFSEAIGYRFPSTAVPLVPFFLGGGGSLIKDKEQQKKP